MSHQGPSQVQSPGAVTTDGSGDETPGVNHDATTAAGSSDEGAGSPAEEADSGDDEQGLDLPPPNPNNAGQYHINDLPRNVILRAFSHDGERITTMQADVQNANDEAWLIFDPETEITWAIKLANIKSKFHRQSARKFMAFVEGIRRLKNNPNIRGGILCRAVRASENQYPFSAALQQDLLSRGYILLAIPDEE